MVRSGPLPRKILYVQRTGGGGSVISLLLLVKRLDPGRYQPSVLFYEPSPHAADFVALGVQTLCLNPEASGTPPAGGSGQKRKMRLKARHVPRWLVLAVRLVKRDWPDAKRIARVAREIGADLIHSNISPSVDRASIIGASLARCRHVCHVRFLRGQSRLADLPLSHLVDHYVYISEAVRHRFSADTGVAHEKGSVIYNPFEFNPLPSLEKIRRVRSHLGVAEHEILVANVGRLVAWKGQDIFLRAFAKVLHNQHPHARAVIVGGAKQTPVALEYEAGLHLLADQLGISHRVIFTGHRPDVEEIMAAADLVVHSSSEPEPFGRVVMEAMALETPVLATAAGGVLEMVRSGATGTLVPIGDVDAMARAMGEVLDDMDRAQTMARRALESSGSRFDSATHVRAIERLYDRVLGPS